MEALSLAAVLMEALAALVVDHQMEALFVASGAAYSNTGIKISYSKEMSE